MRLKELRNGLTQEKYLPAIAQPDISRMERGDMLPGVAMACIMKAYIQAPQHEWYTDAELNMQWDIVREWRKALRAEKKERRKWARKLTIRLTERLFCRMNKQMKQHNIKTQQEYLEFCADAVDSLYKEKSPVSNTGATVSETSDNPKMCIYSVSQEA